MLSEKNKTKEGRKVDVDLTDDLSQLAFCSRSGPVSTSLVLEAR